MQLKRLYMQNFLGVGEEPVEIIFPNTHGITYVKGINLDVANLNGERANTEMPSNGSGKSACIVEAIMFGLTGRTLRNLKMEEILHNGAKSQGIVEVEYDNIKIVRKIKPNDVELWIDSKNKTVTSSKTETKKKIEETVGVNFETLANILIFGQHNMFSFLEAGEPEKREIIEDLLNLKEYNLYEEKARATFKDLKNKVKALADQHTTVVAHQIGQQKLLQDQQDALTAYLTKLQNDLKHLEETYNQMPDAIAIRRQWADYDEYIKNRNSLTTVRDNHIREANDYSTKLNAMIQEMQGETVKKQPLADKLQIISGKFVKLDEIRRTKMEELDALIAKGKGITERKEATERELRQKLEEIKPSQDYDYTILTIKQDRLKAQSEIDKLHGQKTQFSKDAICPTCFGKVNPSNIDSVIQKWQSDAVLLDERLVNTVTSKNAEEKTVADTKKQVQEKYNLIIAAISEEINALRKEYQDTKKEIDDEYAEAREKLNKMKVTAEKKLADFDQSIKDKYDAPIKTIEAFRDTARANAKKQEGLLAVLPVITTPSYSLDALAQIEAQKTAALQTIETLKAEINNPCNPYADIIKKLQTSVDEITKKVEEVHTQIVENEGLLPYYDFWAGAMGKNGIKSFIIAKIIPTLNEQLDYWMQVIYQGAISLKFDKLLNVEMRNNASGNQMIFGQGSGGERKRVDVAIMLAFRQIMKMSTNKDPSILIFDEPIENLDGEGTHRFFDVMKDMARTTHIYTITHNKVMLELLQNYPTICVQKKNGAISLCQS